MKSVDLHPTMGYKFEYMNSLILIYIEMGEYDKAIKHIKEQLEEPGYYITPWALRLHPRFDPLRDDPRFQALVK